MSIGGKWLLFAGFGLLPLWISIAWLLVEASKEPQPHEFWNVAPWMVVPGLGYSTFTMVFASVTLAAFNSAKGPPERKKRHAIMTLAVQVLLTGAAIAYFYYDSSTR